MTWRFYKLWYTHQVSGAHSNIDTGNNLTRIQYGAHFFQKTKKNFTSDKFLLNSVFREGSLLYGPR